MYKDWGGGLRFAIGGRFVLGLAEYVFFHQISKATEFGCCVRKITFRSTPKMVKYILGKTINSDTLSDRRLEIQTKPGLASPPSRVYPC